MFYGHQVKQADWPTGRPIAQMTIVSLLYSLSRWPMTKSIQTAPGEPNIQCFISWSNSVGIGYQFVNWSARRLNILSVGSPLAKNIFNSIMYQIPFSQCLKITYKLIKILTIDTPKIIQQKVWPFGQSAYQLAKWHLWLNGYNINIALFICHKHSLSSRNYHKKCSCRPPIFMHSMNMHSQYASTHT